MKIVIVDDNILILKQLSRYLENKGHNVIENSNAMDALSDILKHQPDLVISDLLMPYLTGNELYETLNHTHKSQTKMLFITSLQDEYIKDMSDFLNQDNVIKKPLNFSQLDQKMNALIN